MDFDSLITLISGSCSDDLLSFANAASRASMSSQLPAAFVAGCGLLAVVAFAFALLLMLAAICAPFSLLLLLLILDFRC